MHHDERSWSVWLDAFRWIAALLVLVTHAGGRLFPRDISAAEGLYKLELTAFRFMEGFSHQAVMVFFVLSGFLVGGSVLGELAREQDIDLRRYFTKRLVRLWIVLIPVLFIGLLLDYFGMYVMKGLEAGVYEARLADRLSPSTFVCNVFFLQNIACKELGSNGALWSLANEFWYYVLFPIAVLAVAPSKRSGMFRLGCAAAFCAVCVALFVFQFAGWSILPYMAIWLIGVGAYRCRRGLFVSQPGVALGIFVAALLCSRVGIRHDVLAGSPFVQFAVDIFVALSFANLIIALRAGQGRFPLPFPRTNLFLASFSYSLYCIHTPVLQAVLATLNAMGMPGFQMVPSGVSDWAIAFGVIALPIVAALLLASATEWHTDRFRRLITRRTHREQPQLAS
jgi:peptidoglycan/LPS O-acetylase OafA/YrhL